MTERLLRASGIVAGPLYLSVGLAQAVTRDGFDMRRHALSLLSNGDLGWIQIANFLVAGILVMAGAAGLRRTPGGHRGGTWGPGLLAVYGAGLIGAGVFVADPGAGFPPGAAAPEGGMTRAGLLHFASGAVGFYAVIGACFVFARRFAGLKQTSWAVYSGVTGAGFLASFIAIASGPPSPATMVGFYIAVAWLWIWHTALHLKR